jgi:hypothetical protein
VKVEALAERALVFFFSNHRSRGGDGGIVKFQYSVAHFDLRKFALF